MVVGSPGSGKSYCIINQFIKQQIEKGYALYCYDFKFPDLSLIVYNHLLKNKDKYKANVQFYVINFDDPRHSHRCMNPCFMGFALPACFAARSFKYSCLRIILHAVQNRVKFFAHSAGQLSLILWRIIKSAFQFCTKRRRTRQTGCGGAVLLLNFQLSS